MNASDPRHEWMQEYADGVASAETTARLEAALRTDPAFRALFIEYLNLDVALSAAAALEGDVESVPVKVKVVAFAPAKPRRPAARWLVIAAALVAALFAAKLFLPPANVARISRMVAVEWDGDMHRHQAGQTLAPGWLHLRAGVVQIDFSLGARVVLEGPAEFQLVSNNAAFLRRGKLRAVVPESAHGFTIRGEGFSAVDRGTEFGVIAGEKAEVHVFTGRVELARATGTEPSRVLEAGRAARLGTDDWLDIPADASAFVSLDQMERYAAWRHSAAALDAHPAALVHCDFEQARALTNRVAGRDISASITGCEPGEGRWPGKAALEFKGAEDRVRFTVPGEMQSLTLLAWVRIDGLPNVQSSLLMSESELSGDVHWYLHRRAGVGFAIVGPDGRWRSFHTGTPLRRELLGKWHLFAVTFDGATGKATHYFDGQPVASESFGQMGSLRLRTVEMGNWGIRPGTTLRASRNVIKEPAGYLRNLHGRIDEFAILSSPLSKAEIQRLYAAGRPTADTASPPLSK